MRKTKNEELGQMKKGCIVNLEMSMESNGRPTVINMEGRKCVVNKVTLRAFYEKVGEITHRDIEFVVPTESYLNQVLQLHILKQLDIID